MGWRAALRRLRRDASDNDVIFGPDAHLVVVRPMFGRRVVKWRWTDCNGAAAEMSPWFAKPGHFTDVGDPPTVCVAALDFTCPVHARGLAIAMGPAT